MITPTPATHCFICPPPNQTLATVCTQIGCPTHQVFCPTQPVVCNLQPTQPVVCGVLPPSFGCTQGCQQGFAQQQPEAMMAAPAHPNTAATLCTRQPACPPHTVHNSICICPTPSAVHQCGGPAHRRWPPCARCRRDVRRTTRYITAFASADAKRGPSMRRPNPIHAYDPAIYRRGDVPDLRRLPLHRMHTDDADPERGVHAVRQVTQSKAARERRLFLSAAKRPVTSWPNR